MDNAARLKFISDAVDGLELESGPAADLVYQLSMIPSVSIDLHGTMSFTDRAIAMVPDFDPTSQDGGPVFDGG